MISNKKSYGFLNKNIQNVLNLKSPFIELAIQESCRVKKEIVEKDEKERNLRKVLNFGHTFAHAYEASLNYSKKLNHGEAVLLGIKSAVNFSYKNKLLSKNDYISIIDHLKISKLPSNLKNYFSKKNVDKILTYMTKDKKNNSDKISLILLKRIGFPLINKEFKKSNLKSFLKKEL